MAKKIKQLEEAMALKEAQELVLNRYNISKAFTQSFFSKFTQF